MKRSHKSGLGFGVTSGIITPLGLIVGLYSGTQSTPVILGGILTIAIADAFSDSLGVHVSKEADHSYSTREVWEATLSTFFSKFSFALLFMFPFIFFSAKAATIISVVGGLSVLSIFSYVIAKNRGSGPWWAIGEHVGIAAFVVAITYYLPPLIESLIR